MLYLIATPIGNLKDISLRALETLQTVDYILCEDTRHSLKLLTHFQIKKPLKSYHKFNEKAKLEKVISDLKNGKVIALLSDGGTPTICDPGKALVDLCLKEQIQVTSLPGPCSLINALILTGFDSQKFQFIGFLPKKKEELKNQLLELLDYSGTSICFESPKRLFSTLKILAELSPQRAIAVAKEMTKVHEKNFFSNALELSKAIQDEFFKGEVVLLISGKEKEIPSAEDPAEFVKTLENQYQISTKEAIRLAAKLLQLPKKKVYRDVLQKNQD